MQSFKPSAAWSPQGVTLSAAPRFTVQFSTLDQPLFWAVTVQLQECYGCYGKGIMRLLNVQSSGHILAHWGDPPRLNDPVKMGWWPCFGTLTPNSWWRTNHLDDFNIFTAAVPWFQPPSPKKPMIPADARRILETGERDAVGAASLQHMFWTCDRKISSGDHDTMGKISVRDPVAKFSQRSLYSYTRSLYTYPPKVSWQALYTLHKLTIEDP